MVVRRKKRSRKISTSGLSGRSDAGQVVLHSLAHLVEVGLVVLVRLVARRQMELEAVVLVVLEEAVLGNVVRQLLHAIAENTQTVISRTHVQQRRHHAPRAVPCREGGT